MERPTNIVNQYIDHVLRTIDIVKFMHIWIGHDLGEGSRLWKKVYYEALFKETVDGRCMRQELEGLRRDKEHFEHGQQDIGDLADIEADIKTLTSKINDERKKFSRTHDRTIAGRKLIYHLYNEVCVSLHYFVYFC